MMLIDRIRFWLSKKPFIYTSEGKGFAVEGYNPFTDMVLVRMSQFGYVTGHNCISRSEFAALQVIPVHLADASSLRFSPIEDEEE